MSNLFSWVGWLALETLSINSTTVASCQSSSLISVPSVSTISPLPTHTHAHTHTDTGRPAPTWVSLAWHWTEPGWIDWTATCPPVCQPWIICNDIPSGGGGPCGVHSLWKMDSSIKRSSWKADRHRRRSLDPERCPTDSSRRLAVNVRPGCGAPCEPWAPIHPLPPTPACLIEPCLTQKATLSLFGDRPSWHLLPFSPRHVA